MSTLLTTEKTSPPLVQPSPHCSQCGGFVTALALLDSRNGHTFRLFRCDGCDATKWVRDR